MLAIAAILSSPPSGAFRHSERSEESGLRGNSGKILHCARNDAVSAGSTALGQTVARRQRLRKIQCSPRKGRCRNADREFTVYVVNDDPDLRDCLDSMVRSMGLEPKSYRSAEDFLDGYRDALAGPRCMVLDVLMPGLSGLGLQEMLLAQGVADPHYHGYRAARTSPSAVKAMSAGALDFLEKPVNPRTLLVRIREAIDTDVRQRRQATQKARAGPALDRLSARQREVFDCWCQAPARSRSPSNWASARKPSPSIARLVLEKMQVESVVELVTCLPNPDLPGERTAGDRTCKLNARARRLAAARGRQTPSRKRSRDKDVLRPSDGVCRLPVYATVSVRACSTRRQAGKKSGEDAAFLRGKRAIVSSRRRKMSPHERGRPLDGSIGGAEPAPLSAVFAVSTCGAWVAFAAWA